MSEEAGVTMGVPRPGRRVRLVPTPPGLWMTLLGVAVAALAPLFGFLIGSVMDQPDDDALGPIFVGLFIGVMVGGLGVASAIIGGFRWWRYDDAAAEPEEAR